MELEAAARRGIRPELNWVALMVLATSLVACFGNDREAPGEMLAVGEDRRLEGRVMAVDGTPMFVDGDGEIILQTEQHGRVLIRIPAREQLCQAHALRVFRSIISGDSVRLMGRVNRPREISVCAEDTHFLEKIDGN